MPRCGQLSRNAKTWPLRPRPMRMGSPSSVLCTIRPGRKSPPDSATYHNPRNSSALRSCMMLSAGAEAARSRHRHERQVGVAGFASRLREHAMHLATMMRLMIEHVRDQQPSRLADFRFDGAGIIAELAGERGRVESIGPFDHDRVECRPLALQIVPLA